MIDFNECETNTHECNLTTSTCNNTFGSYNCSCHDGFYISGPNECSGIFLFINLFSDLIILNL